MEHEATTTRPASHRASEGSAAELKTSGEAKADQVERAAEKAHEIVDKTAEKARDIEAKLRDGAESGKAQLSDQQERATEALNATRQEVERFVRERPLASAGIAFAAGLIAARILRN